MIEIKTNIIELRTKGDTEVIDITVEVQELLTDAKFAEGSVLIFTPGSTAGITTIEFEPGLQKDYPAFFEKIIPSNQQYKHNDTWHDGNGHSHVRASLQGASITVPYIDGRLILGTWQQIILIDFDTHPRTRKVVVQFTGKKN